MQNNQSWSAARSKKYLDLNGRVVLYLPSLKQLSQLE